MVPESLSSENFIDVDHDVIGAASFITEDDILEQLQTHQEVSDNDDNDCDDKVVNDKCTNQLQPSL